MEEEAKKTEEAITSKINKSLGINKFAEELYKAYPNVPKDILGSAVREFIEKLNTLEGIIKNIKAYDEATANNDKHIPHID